MPKIETIKLNKYYEEKKSKSLIAALYDVSLTIPDKSFAAIIGESGCGKTTLIKTINGLYKPDDGKILFDNKNIINIPVQERNISYVSQEYALYPNMTIFENIAYPLKLQKLTIDEITQRVNEVSKLLEIDILLSRKPKVLSGGQQQRVAIARALIKKPEIIFLDEPLANLDPVIRSSILKKLSLWHKRWNNNIVYVTHKLDEVMPYVDYIIEMNNGSVIHEKKVIRNKGEINE
ncbi:ABC transporter ATP-binding protein [Candidatus Izemoplasma sp. B36]|uniref:ABC transporter ATP-binding protein n=1 Tax=Candidatus Izemoplasma sp. B36 TaxID=3242468 RepID=UPI003557D955